MRKGNSQQWIWLIVFLPAIGCLIYLFTEVITKRHVDSVTSNVESVIRPQGRIRDLEKSFEFSSSLENRLALAKAYFYADRVDEAIQLYEEGRQGIFTNDPHLQMQLIEAYYAKERYTEICEIAEKLTNHPDFKKSHTRLVFAKSLEKCGNLKTAEEQLSSFQVRYSDFEGKYEYACFLIRQSRTEEAVSILKDVEQESSRMDRGEKRNHIYWIKQSLNKLDELSKTTA